MLRSMITAANTMNQLQQQLDVISHNIANVNTTGFKKRDAVFGELLAQQFQNLPKTDEAPRFTPDGLRLGVGAKIASTHMQMKQGPVLKTDRSLDLAFTKEGQFFRIFVDGEIQYTRDGAFYLSPSANNPDELMLVTADGYAVLDENDEPITVREGFKDIQVTQNGTMQFIAPNGNVMQTVKIGVSYVTRPQLMQALGENRFAFPADVSAPNAVVNLANNNRTSISMQQYALEQSNVELPKEMSELMITQRSYQFNARAITLSDQMMGLINGIRS